MTLRSHLLDYLSGRPTSPNPRVTLSVERPDDGRILVVERPSGETLAEGWVGMPAAVARRSSGIPALADAVGQSPALVVAAFRTAPLDSRPGRRALQRQVIERAVGAAGARGASSVYVASNPGEGLRSEEFATFWVDALFNEVRPTAASPASPLSIFKI